jgi:hypothetical protein
MMKSKPHKNSFLLLTNATLLNIAVFWDVTGFCYSQMELFLILLSSGMWQTSVTHRCNSSEYYCLLECDRFLLLTDATLLNITVFWNVAGFCYSQMELFWILLSSGMWQVSVTHRCNSSEYYCLLGCDRLLLLTDATLRNITVFWNVTSFCYSQMQLFWILLSSGMWQASVTHRCNSSEYYCLLECDRLLLLTDATLLNITVFWNLTGFCYSQMQLFWILLFSGMWQTSVTHRCNSSEYYCLLECDRLLLQMQLFWILLSSGMLQVSLSLTVPICVLSRLAYSSILKMETDRFSETTVYIYQTTWRYIP